MGELICTSMNLEPDARNVEPDARNVEPDARNPDTDAEILRKEKEIANLKAKLAQSEEQLIQSDRDITMLVKNNSEQALLLMQQARLLKQPSSKKIAELTDENADLTTLNADLTTLNADLIERNVKLVAYYNKLIALHRDSLLKIADSYPTEEALKQAFECQIAMLINEIDNAKKRDSKQQFDLKKANDEITALQTKLKSMHDKNCKLAESFSIERGIKQAHEYQVNFLTGEKENLEKLVSELRHENRKLKESLDFCSDALDLI